MRIGTLMAVGVGWMALVSSGHAAPERIGKGYVLEAPAPVGFVRITPDMETLSVLLSSFSNTGISRTVAGYIPAELATMAREETLEALDRYCLLQVVVRVEDVQVTADMFAQAQPGMVKNLEGAEGVLKEKAGALFSQASERASEGLGLEKDSLKVGLDGVGVLPPHDVAEGRIGFSSFMRLGIDGTGGGGPEESKLMTLTTYVSHAGERMIQHICYGTAEDLVWTRETALAWQQAVAAANAP
jgi:hypothetical protein